MVDFDVCVGATEPSVIAAKSFLALSIYAILKYSYSKEASWKSIRKQALKAC